MSTRGYVLGPPVRELASELAARYVAGELVIVAGAGVSRASGLPGWNDMVRTLQFLAAEDLKKRVDPSGLDKVLSSIHSTDPISRADSLQRLVRGVRFRGHLHAALYPTAEGQLFQPSVAHWHIASLLDRRLMPDVFTSNYDDLLEDAKLALGRAGRVRHFHGRLPQSWSGGRLYDPPVVTSRDYLSAEDDRRYESLAAALRDRTVLLVGFSLADPNLTRIIKSQARDCRAILVASQGTLSAPEQRLRVDLLERYWRGLNVAVTAIEAHEELPAFLLALRREVLSRQSRSLAVLGDRALRASVRSSLWTWPGLRDWRDQLRDAVTAAKELAPSVAGDTTLRAGFYAIERDGYLVHLVGSASKQRQLATRQRRLLADHEQPWGAAGYAYAAGVPIASSAVGPAFDRNVPEAELLRWQQERSSQGRLPAASVLCVPAWVRFSRGLVPVGVLYFSSRRGGAFDDPQDGEELRAVLEITFASMIEEDRSVGGRIA